MKKIVTTLFILFAVIPAIKAQGGEKSKLSGGIIAESNVSGFFHSNLPNGKSNMKLGFGIGGFAEMDLSKVFSLQGALIAQYKHSDFSWDDWDGHYRQWSVELPIYAMAHYSLRGGGRLYAGVGPYTCFGFDARFKTNDMKLDLYEKNEQTGVSPMKETDTGFAVKMGYEFACGIQLNVSYKMSMTSVIDENVSDAKMRPYSFGVGLAYRFK